ncbi:hypothetical protein OZ410_06470 [Robiginitalea sp. M366]|uniref:hypothetical protein n=1 Tax=Robiginitalea aestuariiviva TaxID=3036903 RepID=UPI00240E5F26|nr:hypothetical protein [Robiginitalea aestuariiviva]MDG1571954.1 hypothetical protein [Robiginitalea aestuariiviva]
MTQFQIIYALLAFLILGPSCLGQKTRVEVALMECWFNSFGEDSAKVKAMFLDYEHYLVREGVLEGPSQKGYKSMHQLIAKGKRDYKVRRSFSRELENITRSLEDYNSCKQILLNDSVNFDSSKLIRYHAVFDSITTRNEYKRSDIALGILSVLDEMDFDYDYYKVRAFILQDLLVLSEIWDIRNSEAPDDFPID